MAKILPSTIIEALDRYFPFAKEEQSAGRFSVHPINPREGSNVDTILTLCQELSPGLLPSVGDARFLQYRQALATITHEKDVWERGEKYTLPFHTSADEQGRSAFTVLRMILSDCPDDPVAAVISELAFVTDADVREDLGQDIEESKRALANRDWKGATVIAGSVIEGLLLWALDQKTEPERQTAMTTVTRKRGWRSAPPNALEDWKLFQFVAISAELGLVDAETEKQADLARDFRNYIHPGRVKTKGKKCDEKTALLTRAAVLAVVEDLRKRFP
jgi:hypothetical protein